MLFSKSDTNKSKSIEALIPMIDLFAVLAIVFMIYSSDEIIASQEKSQETIEQIATDYKKLQEEVAAAEQARQDRREILAQNAVKSLEEIEAEREQKAKELVNQFTQMLAEQQSQAAVDYERLVAKFEVEHEQEVEKQKAEFEAEKQKEVETKVAQLEQQKEAEVSSAKKEFDQIVAAKEAQLETTTQAIIAAEMERVKDLTKQEEQLEQQSRMQVAKLEQKRTEALAEQKQEMEAQQQTAAQAAADSAKQQAQAAAESAKQQATAEAEQTLAQELAAQEAREQIVDNLLENFKDSDDRDVNIDQKTGKVRINFQESYFVRGSAELSDSMKDLLRVMIPKYAQSIYEVSSAAKQVESLKISGMTSPIFRGRYFDINDTTPEGEEAYEYNMKLSNDRALAMYNFIFDSDEMGEYEYRARLKADLGISALGYQNAAPVPSELVGQKATCLEYDCKKEQASIFEFRLYSEL
jgi:myosin heavy subunit